MHDLILKALELATPILLPVVLVLVAQLARAALRKFGLDASDAELALVRGLVEDGIHYVEQAAGVKAKAGGPAIPSADKKRMAIEFVERLARAKGVSEPVIALVDAFVEAALSRASGALEGVGVMEATK